MYSLSLTGGKNRVLIEVEQVVADAVHGLVGASVFCPGNFDGNIEPFF